MENKRGHNQHFFVSLTCALRNFWLSHNGYNSQRDNVIKIFKYLNYKYRLTVI